MGLDNVYSYSNFKYVLVDDPDFEKITNLYNTPDIGAVSGETTAYKTLGLFDTATATRGSASGTQVGVARARTIQYDSGTMGNTDAVFRLYLFDIRPSVILQLGKFLSKVS